MQTVIGLFDTYEDADRAVQALKESGFINQQISVLARDRAVAGHLEVEDKLRAEEESSEEIVRKTGLSALGGGVAGGLGGLLVGLGLLTIPGIGPAVAAGSALAALTTTAAGAAIGAATGGMVGALVALGVKEEQAETYAESVKRGGILLMVESEDHKTEIVETILKEAGGVDVDSRRAEFLEDGWVHFDEKTIPPTELPGGISQR